MEKLGQIIKKSYEKEIILTLQIRFITIKINNDKVRINILDLVRIYLNTAHCVQENENE
ncbi:MAG: hypothetical protein HeimC2_05550 [Candidatus Heimdallarchaeota archaeon LC_2]|nr:MAG: hypothetical protein HeimC2_05550 [Candidatus Heimdallarchaeota archaeon LC_2]